MKIKRLAIAVHILVWVLLLVIPYVSTDQIFSSLDPESDTKYLLLCFVLSAVLLVIFYFNYFLLIPRYLLAKKYWRYCLFLLLAIVIAFLLLSTTFLLSDFNPETLARKHPASEKIIPVIIINALSLWLLAIVSSVLWTVYNRLKQTESEKLSAQIASLKSQINPHFLFNTLNNIYATAIDDSPKAADMVDKLSEMMRYTMKDIQQDFVLLEDEINYISNFIELQKIRLDRSVRLEYHSLETIPPLKIAPMLLIPFIENAFKHGVNSEQKSRIKVKITMNNNEIQLKVLNNKVNVQRDISERSGLGIENTKHRLNLIYPSKNLLVINDSEKEFFVSLYINLQ
ncbi:sensor histidine kinase [Parachryseolinea silvisoli]|uniref:sensor histidine kinase n=1 Tax=Parachryseolinea silvisoli TaxID=2873601 RepID=UPI002265E7DE|nr:sensor histidine kinase [Parachryseolinea silvisoli]MCD9015755.1 sensor histidine kinase [Parachryseolinea silvisoli]